MRKSSSDYMCPMPSDPSLDRILMRAREDEGKNDWLTAAKDYAEALNGHLRSTDARTGTGIVLAETWENVGLCYNRASHQVDNEGDFKKLKQLAADAYKTAAQLFETEGNLNGHGKSSRCDAIAEYSLTRLMSSPSERRERLDRCRTLVQKALAAFEGDGDWLNYGKTCAILLPAIYECLTVASDAGEKQIIGQEGIDRAEKAISVLSKLGNRNDLLLVYSAASLQNWYVANISEQEETGEKLARKALDYSEKAVELSKEIIDPYCVAMSRWPAALCSLFFTEKIERSLEYANEMLQQGSLLRDNYMKGVASYLLAFVSDWMFPKESTRDQKKARCEAIIDFAKQGVAYLELVGQDYIIAETCQFYAESYSSLAREVEVGADEKRALLNKAIEIGRKGLEHAAGSGSPDSTASILHALSKALQLYSGLEQIGDVKADLLAEALVHRKEYNRIVEKTFPSNVWVLGVGKYYAGLVEAELSKLEPDQNNKVAVLRNAVSDTEEGVSYCSKWISSRPVPSLIVTVAEFEDKLGGMLNELSLLTGDAHI